MYISIDHTHFHDFIGMPISYATLVYNGIVYSLASYKNKQMWVYPVGGCSQNDCIAVVCLNDKVHSTELQIIHSMLNQELNFAIDSLLNK